MDIQEDVVNHRFKKNKTEMKGNAGHVSRNAKQRYGATVQDSKYMVDSNQTIAVLPSDIELKSRPRNSKLMMNSVDMSIKSSPCFYDHSGEIP
jgi:hypothetical protein